MSKLRLIKQGSLLVALILVLNILWSNKYWLHDQYRLIGYQASPEIQQLAEAGSMSGFGKRLFYVSDPQILDKESFNEHCQFEATIVLGCYASGNIYIYNVTEDKLDGIKQVTAAHEMLHVAYERLGGNEKKEIDRMVNEEYAKISDPRISTLAELYKKQDPDIVPNELHSILATEVNQLSPSLEEYYSRYFNERSRVVELAQKYEAVFEQLRELEDKYDAELLVRKKEIDTLEQRLDSLKQQLDTKKHAMDELLRAGDYSTYNKLVKTYNSLVAEYNDNLANLKTLIAEYNNIVGLRNDIAIQHQALSESINSKYQQIDGDESL